MATVPRTFTDDTGALRCERQGPAVMLFATGNTAIVATHIPWGTTNAAHWSALATACEASETLRPYARRIRHMLGTAAGIDTP